MGNELPTERQQVEVKFNGDHWQPAVYRYGQFIDAYGLPLDREKISDWRALEKDMPEPTPRHKGWTRP